MDSIEVPILVNASESSGVISRNLASVSICFSPNRVFLNHRASISINATKMAAETSMSHPELYQVFLQAAKEERDTPWSPLVWSAKLN